MNGFLSSTVNSGAAFVVRDLWQPVFGRRACEQTLVRGSYLATVGLVVVGVFNGPCTARRLNQAGASVTFGDLEALGEEIATGGRNLVAAGLPPTSMGKPQG